MTDIYHCHVSSGSKQKDIKNSTKKIDAYVCEESNNMTGISYVFIGYFLHSI